LTKLNKFNSIDGGEPADSILQSVEEALFSAVDLLNETLAPSQQLAKSRDTILVDSGGKLDSIAVVNLLVFLEDEVASHFGRELDLVGADPFESEDLKTVGSVCDALCRKLSR
jgi:acyl carrier protein